MILKNKKIFFFIDYSKKIGAGHYKRSLLIAFQLKKNNFVVKFIKINRANNFVVCNFKNSLPDKSILPVNRKLNKKIFNFLNYNKVNFVFFDIYNYNNPLISFLEKNKIKTASFLSSPKDKTQSTIKINLSPYNYFSNNHVNSNNLLGLNYIVFKKDFVKYSKLKNNTISDIKRVSVILGGSHNETYFLLIINKIIRFYTNINFKLFFLNKDKSFYKVKEYVKNINIKNVKLIINSNNIARELYSTNIIITSGGYSSFESSFLKKPFFTIQISQNQRYNCIAFEKLGASINLGDIKKNNKNLKKIFEKTINDKVLLENMVQNSKKLFKKWNNNNLVNSLLKKI